MCWEVDKACSSHIYRLKNVPKVQQVFMILKSQRSDNKVGIFVLVLCMTLSEWIYVYTYILHVVKSKYFANPQHFEMYVDISQIFKLSESQT